MNARRQNVVEMHCRRVRRSAMPRISPLPRPEDVFVDWLLSVPHDADLEAAARTQIALIDQRAPLHPDLACLRALLAAVATDGDRRRPVASL